MVKVEIDSGSGFCFGVVNAIKKAEEELDKGGTLYCLGDIVHNNYEVERLQKKGLITIDRETFSTLRNVKVLLRAHGEPPETYRIAAENNIEIIDATCPVVLKLQQQIKNAYQESGKDGSQIVIYGKVGHAEVNGLVGQTSGEALVIEDSSDVSGIDMNRNIRLYSQTTKSVDGFRHMVETITRKASPGISFKYYDTICRQVSNRIPHIREFAGRHDLILFVCGKKSSNGRILYDECAHVNKNSYLISDIADIDERWLSGVASIGICGATSTPKWLMEKVQEYVKSRVE